ncbi:MAG TPA: hypothetical protein VEM95_00955 [Thermoplasmata archaeon]|nr:hypothetical protein [Thermoplasmata archaeon]
MPVKMFELVALDAKRFFKSGDRLSNLRIDNNGSVTLVTEVSAREAAVDFRFTTNYMAPEGVIGRIQIEGKVVFEGDARAIVASWSGKGRMPDDVASEVLTVIMNNCIPEATVIARDLRLPPPIPIPPVQVQSQPPPKGKGRGDVEVA